MSANFIDNSKEVKSVLEQALIAGLYAAAAEVESRAATKTPVDTGQLKGSWAHKVDENKLEAVIGSPLENAIWNEFGTGEYAAEGKGRKGGWYVPADKLSAKAKTKMRKVVIKGKEFYFTKGKKPQRTLQNAFKKHTIQKIIENEVKEAFKDSGKGSNVSVNKNGSNGLKVNLKGAVNQFKQQYKKAESAMEKMEK